MSYSFGPYDPFQLSLTGWTLLSGTPAGDSQSVVAQGLEHGIAQDGNGEYIPAAERTYNSTTPLEAEYISDDNATQLQLTDIWDACEALIGTATAITITEFVVRTTNTGDQRARLTVRGHTHQSNVHVVNAFLPDFTSKMSDIGIFSPYGATDFMGCGFGDYDVISSEFSCRIGHIDKQGSAGDWLVGRSQGVMCTAQTVATSDNPPTKGSDNPVTLGSNSYIYESASRGAPPNDFRTWTARGHIYLASSTLGSLVKPAVKPGVAAVPVTVAPAAAVEAAENTKPSVAIAAT